MSRANQDEAAATCEAFNKVNDEMAKMALDDLPQDNMFDDAFDEDDDEAGAKNGKGGDKKQRSWLGKVGKGLYRRTANLASSVGLVDAPMSKEEEDAKNRVFACRSPYASVIGGVAIQDPAEAKVCRSVISLMVRSMGKSLLKGGNVMNTSFPIQCCQPKTILEIGSAMAGYTHIYMPRAVQATDPVERMKNVVSCFIGTMTLTSGNFLKPLNPILGETLQMDYSDGAKLYMEQTCHHPPVSSFYFTGPDNSYTCHGSQTFSVTWGYNKMFITSKGRRNMCFKDGSVISFDYPEDRWGNVFWGEMHHECVGTQTFEDAKNKIRCRITFGNPEGKRGLPTDFFEGCIERYDPANPEKEGTQVLSNVDGSWVGFVDFDKVRYWDVRTCEKMSMCKPRNLLPSDSCFRSDSIALAKKDIQAAQAAKLDLEQVQRAERKLREAVHGKNSLDH
mmetsp:Transcript_39699/g.77698  ORF Transcript_39699/g.77698 Transcript_39699/m.77698 type:complete len:448 (+) Transcript_39699:36-1379(+)